MKHLKNLNINEEFDFENYDDTDLAGMGFEIAIDEMIADAQEAINKTIPNDPKLRREARIEIKKLWMSKISQWIKD